VRLVYVCTLAGALAGCHPPDDRIYAEAKQCHSMLAAALELPPARLREAGFDPSLIDRSAEAELEDALQFGANLEMSSIAVINDLNRATLAYSQSHDAGQTLDALRRDVDGCFRKDGPND